MKEFYGLTDFYRWVRTPSGRSRRPVEIKQGMYIIIHAATGRFFIGKSKTVSKDVDKVITILDKGKFKIKLFNELVANDSDLEILEIPANNRQINQKIKLVEAKLGDNYRYLLCN